MKNADPKPRHLSAVPLWQRLLSLGVLVLFAFLIWSAINGTFDQEVNRVSGWLQRNYFALLDCIVKLWRSLTG